MTMELPDARVGPYIRALRGGLRCLAPDRDYPSGETLDAHLHALDPALSRTLLLPARVDAYSGLPDLSWMDRVRAERAAAEQMQALDPARIARVQDVDPALAQRLIGRVALLEWLADRPISLDYHLEAEVVRAGIGRAAEGRCIRVTMDRRIPRAGWTRIRVDLEMPRDRADLWVERVDGRVVHVRPGVAELLARHVWSPLPGLHRLLSTLGPGPILRLCRGTIGPFWFPGGPTPSDAPAWSREALVLHLVMEAVGTEVRTRSHQDPFSRPLFTPGEGLGCYRGRRLAVSPSRQADAAAWCQARGGLAGVVPLVP